MFEDEDAGTLVEYGLLLALIAIVGIVAMKRLDTRITAEFSKAATDLRLAPLGAGLDRLLRRNAAKR